MKNKIYATIIGLLATTAVAQAQVVVGRPENMVPDKSMNTYKMGSEDYKSVKNNTTLFILQERDYVNLARYQKMLEEVWTVTPFKIVAIDELSRYEGQPNYNFFNFGMYYYEITSSGGTRKLILFDYELRNSLTSTKKSKTYAKIFLHPAKETIQEAVKSDKDRKMIMSTKQMLNSTVGYLYADADIYNWSAGFLRGYLKQINDALDKETTVEFKNEFKNANLLSSLKNETLYISEDAYNINYNVFSFKDKEDVDAKENLKKNYKYAVKILPKEELSQLIVDQKEGIKYVTFTIISGQRFLSVYDSKTNELIYMDYTRGGFGTFNKDMSKLEKAIGK